MRALSVPAQRALLLCSMFAMCMLAACDGAGPVTSGYAPEASPILPGSPVLDVEADPTSFMLAVGCTVIPSDSGFPGVVGFARAEGPFLRFDCRTVDDSLKRQAISRYQEVLRDAVAQEGMTFVVATGNWEITNMYWDCTGGISGGGWYNGTYYELGELYVNCRWVTEWGWVDPYGTPYTGDEIPDEPPGGGGGTPTPPPPPPPPPPPQCPGEDPACWQELTEAEATFLQGLMGEVFQVESTITNPVALAVCRETKQALQNAITSQFLGDPMIYRGTYENDFPYNSHDAQGAGSRIHVDPGIWNAATTAGAQQTQYKRALFVLLLHEIRHLTVFGNNQHPNADAYLSSHQGQSLQPAQLATIYGSDYPFNYIYSQTPGEMCVLPY